MPKFEVVMEQTVTVTVTVSAKDADAATEKAEKYAAHIQIEVIDPDTVLAPKGMDWERGDEGSWEVYETNQA